MGTGAGPLYTTRVPEPLPQVLASGFVLVRGKMSGFYPYPFIDAKTLGYAGVAANTAGLLVVCAAIGVCLVLIGWWLARRQPV